MAALTWNPIAWVAKAVPSRCGVLNRLDQQTSRTEPRGGAPVDRLRCGGFHQREPRGRELCEQCVHSEPLAALEAEHEQIRLLELTEHRRRVGASEHGIAQLGREVAEHCRAKQERPAVGIERREHLLTQVLSDITVITAEVKYRAISIIDASQPQRGQP